MDDIHDIQLKILSKLLFNPKSRYTDLKPRQDMENNAFQFHLDQLIKRGFIQKRDGTYILTDSGKQFANKIDNEKGKIAKQAMTAVRICCTRKIGNSKQILIYTRLKQPWYGCQGFLAGKIDYGETIVESARRELIEETGLAGDPEVVAVTHIRDIDKSSKVVKSDIIFFLCRVEDPTGTLNESGEGKYEWIDQDKVASYITKPFTDMADFLSEVKLIHNFKGHIKLIEKLNTSGTF